MKETPAAFDVYMLRAFARGVRSHTLTVRSDGAGKDGDGMITFHIEPADGSAEPVDFILADGRVYRDRSREPEPGEEP